MAIKKYNPTSPARRLMTVSTFEELSKVLDITAPRLSEILNGRKEPTYRQAQKIATTLQIDANIVLAIS